MKSDHQKWVRPEIRFLEAANEANAGLAATPDLQGGGDSVG